MPLAGSETAGGAAIAASLAGMSETDKQDPAKSWKKILEALFPHLVAHIQVNAGIPVATTGGPTAQTGATVAPGTIT